MLLLDSNTASRIGDSAIRFRF